MMALVPSSEIHVATRVPEIVEEGNRVLRIEVVGPPPSGTDSEDATERRFHMSLIPQEEEAVQASFALPFGPADIERLTVRPIGPNLSISRNQQSSATDELKRLGGQLFGALFEGRRLTILDRCARNAEKNGVGLRLNICTDGLGTDWVPWEFLYDPRRKDFVALSMRTPVIRGRLSRLVRRLEPVAPPIRVLILGSEATGWLGVEKEIEKIRALTGASELVGRVELEVHQDLPRERFLEVLTQSSYHVFHFIGTAIPLGTAVPVSSRWADGGGLVVAGPDERLSSNEMIHPGMLVFPSDLAKIFRSKPDLRLALFDACWTDVFASQVALDVPATLGVRGDITLAGIETFMLGFLRGVLEGDFLDSALTAARQQVDREQTGSREWGLLSLYLQGEPSRLLRLTGDEAPAADVNAGAMASAVRHAKTEPEQHKAELRLKILKRNQAELNERTKRYQEVPAFLEEQLRDTESAIARIERGPISPIPGPEHKATR